MLITLRGLRINLFWYPTGVQLAVFILHYTDLVKNFSSTSPNDSSLMEALKFHCHAMVKTKI